MATSFSSMSDTPFIALWLITPPGVTEHVSDGECLTSSYNTFFAAKLSRVRNQLD